MADIILQQNCDWSKCSNGLNTGSPPAAGDTIYLGSTGSTGYVLTLDKGDSSTYTCVAIHAKAGDNKTPANSGTINPGTYTNYTMDCELYGGTAAALLTNPANKTITSIKKIVAGPGTGTHGIVNNGNIGTVTLALGNAIGVSSSGCSNSPTGVITTITCTGGSGNVSGNNKHGCYNYGRIYNMVATGGGGASVNSHGCLNYTPGLIDNATATGSDGTTSHGIYNVYGTITTITTATGGTTWSCYGVSNYQGLIGEVTNAVRGTSGHGVYNFAASTINLIVNTSGASNNTVYAVSNLGSIGTVTNATGGSAASTHGVYNKGTISLISASTGGSASGAAGVFNDGGVCTTVTLVTGGSNATAHGLQMALGTAVITQATGNISHGVNCTGGTVTVTSAKGGSVLGAYGVAYLAGVCTVNGTDLTGVGGAVGLGSSTQKLKVAANSMIGLWDAATGNSQIQMLESSGIAASSDILSGTPKWTGATTPNIGTMPIYLLQTGKI